jgi:hypothetical protein
MHTIKTGEPFAPLFPNGTVLWRPCFHTSSKARLAENFQFEKTEKGSYMGRVEIGCGQFLWEPAAYPNTVDKHQIHGFVVFMDELPPEDWTHLVVTGVSKAMRLPPVAEPRGGYKGAAIFAKAAKPYKMDEYLKFRQAYFNIMSKNLNAKFDQCKDLALTVWPDEVRPEEKRLVAKYHFKHEDTNVVLDYCHLRQLPE